MNTGTGVEDGTTVAVGVRVWVDGMGVAVGGTAVGVTVSVKVAVLATPKNPGAQPTRLERRRINGKLNRTALLRIITRN